MSFKTSWRIGIDTKKPDELITSGIFKYSRNPIFLFIDMLFVGMALIYPNIFMIVFAIVTVVGLNHQIHHEELFLMDHYKDEYQKYRRKVRRYF
ncbi:methyltransferase family protein [Bacteroidota bacterium]